MILVDSSVWIDHLNDCASRQVDILRELVEQEPLLVGDLILCEVLQGLASDREAALVEKALRKFTIVPIVDAQIAVRAAANYRLLRRKGATIRKRIDLLIGTFCIEHGHVLLHSDRDFDSMRLHLGLRVI